MKKDEERVRIWNTFFMLAKEEAQKLKYVSKGKIFKKEYGKVPLGDVLPDKEFYTLSTILLCYMAIEARANHLIDEMVEKDRITSEISNAAKRLPTENKWYLLPELNKTPFKLKSDKLPHQAINEICKKRNMLIHVNYDTLYKELEEMTVGKTLSLFENFVKAMENMNVVLQRHTEEQQAVIDIGKLEDC